MKRHHQLKLALQIVVVIFGPLIVMLVIAYFVGR